MNKELNLVRCVTCNIFGLVDYIPLQWGQPTLISIALNETYTVNSKFQGYESSTSVLIQRESPLALSGYTLNTSDLTHRETPLILSSYEFSTSVLIQRKTALALSGYELSTSNQINYWNTLHNTSYNTNSTIHVTVQTYMYICVCLKPLYKLTKSFSAITKNKNESLHTWLSD